MRAVTLAALIAVPALVSLAFALPQDRGQEQEHEEGEHEDPLHDLMEELNGTLRGVRGALRTGDLAGAVAPVCELQRIALVAKNEVPGFVLAIEDEEQRAEEALAYRLQMQDLMRGLLDLEAAVAKGDPEAADEAFDALNAFKKQGHDRFKREW